MRWFFKAACYAVDCIYILLFICRPFRAGSYNYLCSYRRLKRNSSNCKKLFPFSETKRNGLSMIRLVVLMMMWVVLLVLVPLLFFIIDTAVQDELTRHNMLDLEFRMPRFLVSPCGLLNFIWGNYLILPNQNIGIKWYRLKISAFGSVS